MKSVQIRELQRKIANLVEESLEDKSINRQVLIGKITKAEAEKIRIKTGIEVNGFYRIIDSEHIRHTMRGHSDEVKEALRGQLPVTEKDFENIPLIIQTDNIIYKGKNKQGNDVILYEEIIDNKYYYAEEIRRGKKQLMLNSMWKRKNNRKAP